MRYSISRCTIQQVISAGGANIKVAGHSGIIFANLDDAQAARLKSQGCAVNAIGRVKAAVFPPVAPPTPILGVPKYTPSDVIGIFDFDDLRDTTDPPLYGTNCTIAIIDTGIRKTHELLYDRVVYSKNLSGGPPGDKFNHGTGVASTALAMAPQCNIVDIQVLGEDGEGTEEDVVMGIEEAISLIDTHPDYAPWVINLSLGAPDDGNSDNALRVACRAALSRGIWTVAAAGNRGPDLGTVDCPACEEYVAAVGSVGLTAEEEFVISKFSARGPTKEGLIKPDVLMVGEDLILASSVSDTATIAKSGTSFSAPMIAALLLLYREGVVRYGGVAYPGEVPPGLDPSLTELLPMEDLLDVYAGAVCAKPEGAPLEKDNTYGFGVPFASYIAQAVGLRPSLAGQMMEMVVPIFAIGMVGMMMSSMMKAK